MLILSSSIELWGEEGVQEQLEGSKRNKHVYEKLSSALAKHCHQDRQTVPGKIKKLSQEYKKSRTITTLTSREEGDGSFMIKSIKFLATDQSVTHPPVLLDTLSDDSHTPQSSAEIEDSGVSDEEAATALDGKLQLVIQAVQGLLKSQ